MDCAATHPNEILRFFVRDIILNVDSGAAYLVIPNAKSGMSRYF